MASAKALVHALQEKLDEHGQDMGDGTYVTLSAMSLKMHSALHLVAREAELDAVRRTESESSYELDLRLSGFRVHRPTVEIARSVPVRTPGA